MTRPIALAACTATLALALGGCTRQEIDNAGKSIASAAPALASDALIVARIESAFVAIDGDSALHVAVASHGGAVRLSGRTKSATIANRYVAAAKGVSGVESVTAQLRADAALPSTSARVADFALAAAVRANLLGQAGLNGVGVRVNAAQGHVTLRGRVKTAAVRETLGDAAKSTTGVTAVTNDLQVDS
ncbi:MAG: hypothetical protein NVSMB21_08320 [Vulcanimicrobiaceae bacterium]